MSSCDSSDGKLQVINASDREIVFAYEQKNLNNETDDSPPYPIDESGNPMLTKEFIKGKYSKFVMPHEIKRMWTFGYWEDIFIPGTKVSFYILDAHTVKEVPWKQIRQKKLYLRKYDYPLEEMQKSHWQIKYTE